MMDEEFHESHCNSCFSSTCTLPTCPTTACPNHCGFRQNTSYILQTFKIDLDHISSRLHPCKLPDHLSEVCPLQQVSFTFFPILRRIGKCKKIALVSPSFPRPQVDCINSCYGCPHLLLRQHRASHLEVGDILQTLSEGESGSKYFSSSFPVKNTALPRQPGRLLPVLEQVWGGSGVGQIEIDLSGTLSSVFHNGQGLLVWIDRASFGILSGVKPFQSSVWSILDRGLWGMINRDRCGSLSGVEPFKVCSFQDRGHWGAEVVIRVEQKFPLEWSIMNRGCWGKIGRTICVAV